MFAVVPRIRSDPLKTASFAFVVLLSALPMGLRAQDSVPRTPAAPAPPSIPSLMAEREIGRSKRCVPAIARFTALQQELEPLYRRANRIQALNAAVGAEDSVRVAPFNVADSVEVAVRDWFVADQELARQYLTAPSETLLSQRTAARDRLRQRLQQALDPLGDEVERRIAASEGVTTAVQECEDAIFVRSAVLEACQTETSPVCEDAKATEPRGRYAFVNAANDLWDVEELRPWTEPAQLYRQPDGSLAGARTATRARRGNLILTLGLEPMIRARSTLAPEEITEMDTNLDSLDFVFEDPRYAMSPVLTIQLNLAEPIGGETHYILHFGDLSDPLNDVIWSAPVAAGRMVQAVIAPAGWILNALARGEGMSFTAVKSAQEGGKAEGIFSLPVASVGQSRTVGALLGYMKSGQLGRDLTALIPPTPPTGTPAAPAPGAPPRPPDTPARPPGGR
jgi:hypothetical protein